jgi:GNAT superfamily N-acetyltransferase
MLVRDTQLALAANEGGSRWAAESQLNGTEYFKEPIACTEGERREFAHLVRQGFEGSDEGLHGRIRDAEWLAFHYAVGDTLAAIAGLKTPDGRYRHDLYEKADARVSPAEFKLELGWVFVVPVHRGHRIGESLCRLLLARVPASSVFATTRPNNDSMIRILLGRGFAPAGKPYPRRNEKLVLFLRSSPAFKAPRPAA